jgi:hypothetical protein
MDLYSTETLKRLLQKINLAYLSYVGYPADQEVPYPESFLEGYHKCIEDITSEADNSTTYPKLPLQQQTMLEPFTERLGNPVTPGPGNAKELRETKPTATEHEWVTFKKADEWAATLEAAQQYTNTKQKSKQLPMGCVDGFWDLIGQYLTTGEVTPQEFVDCIKEALAKEVEHQQHQIKTIENTLELVNEIGKMND